MVFALELKLSKSLRGLVHFVLQLKGGLRHSYKYGSKCTNPAYDLESIFTKIQKTVSRKV